MAKGLGHLANNISRLSILLVIREIQIRLVSYLSEWLKLKKEKITGGAGNSHALIRGV